MTFTGSLKLFFDRLAMFGLEICGFYFMFQRLDVGAADAVAKGLGELCVDHLSQAAELPLNGFGFSHQGSQNAVLGPLLVDEVVAEDLRLWLELAVDAAVALLHAAWVPGDIEVEQVPAVGLKVQAFAGGIGGNQDTDRMFAGWALKACLISSRLSGGVGPWKIAIRCSARSVPSMAADSCWSR